MHTTEADLLTRDAHRDIGAELLESVREMKQGRKGKAHSPVAQARYAARLSQRQFAQLLGVSVRTLQDWEQGRRKPSGAARTLIEIARRHPEILKEIAA